MIAFRILLIVIIIGIISYTGIVGFNHGWNLLPIFFGDMSAMTWAGQFNFDFMCFLTLSGLWLAWRHHFSLSGFVHGCTGFFWWDNDTRPTSPYCKLQSKWRHKNITVGESQGNS